MFCALALVVLGLSSCDLFGSSLAITVSFAPPLLVHMTVSHTL